jgi:hypothetical protein
LSVQFTTEHYASVEKALQAHSEFTSAEVSVR